MTLATGVGSMPGDDQRDFDEAVRLVLGELPDLPYLPEVPGPRGDREHDRPGPGRGGRASAPTCSRPAGGSPTRPASTTAGRAACSPRTWTRSRSRPRATPAPSRCRSPGRGRWPPPSSSRAATRCSADHGARRELAQALAEGLRDHVRDVRRRVPGVERLVVQVDEPALPAVLGGAVPTASGFGRHRTVHPPEASEALGWVLAAVDRGRGAEPWVHSCAAGTPLGAAARRGRPRAVGRPGVLTARDHDDWPRRSRRGRRSRSASCPPSTRPPRPPRPRSPSRCCAGSTCSVSTRTELCEQLVLTPACGLAGASPAWARTALGLVTAAEGHVTG